MNLRRDLLVRLTRAGSAVVLAAGLIALAAVPTGADSPEDTVAGDERVAARVDVDGAAVLLVSTGGDLRVTVAYHRSKGWFGADVDPPADDAAAAWTATAGTDEVPALSAAYGRSPGALVLLRWVDGELSQVVPQSDGAWLVARPGRIEPAALVVLDANGALVREMAWPVTPR